MSEKLLLRVMAVSQSLIEDSSPSGLRGREGVSEEKGRDEGGREGGREGWRWRETGMKKDTQLVITAGFDTFDNMNAEECHRRGRRRVTPACLTHIVASTC